MECKEMVVLPAAHPEKEAHYIGLLFSSYLLDVLVVPILAYLLAAARWKGRA